MQSSFTFHWNSCWTFCIPSIELIIIWPKNICHRSKGNETNTFIVKFSSTTYGSFCTSTFTQKMNSLFLNVEVEKNNTSPFRLYNVSTYGMKEWHRWITFLFIDLPKPNTLHVCCHVTLSGPLKTSEDMGSLHLLTY